MNTQVVRFAEDYLSGLIRSPDEICSLDSQKKITDPTATLQVTFYFSSRPELKNQCLKCSKDGCRHRVIMVYQPQNNDARKTVFHYSIVVDGSECKFHCEKNVGI